MTHHGANEFRIDLRPELDAAATARHFVQEHSNSLPADLTADAELLVSELVTNAVLHGRPTITLEMTLDPPLLGVAVRDEGDGLPPSTPREPGEDATGGRGLMIVDRVSSSWGVVPDEPPPGKTVWFQLEASDNR